MLPEERARKKIDKQLKDAGWDVVARNEYIPQSTSAVKEALMQGNTESDYLLFVDDKAIAVVEAKKEDNPLGEAVQKQAENYCVHPQSWYGLWFDGLIPLCYMANGNKIYFKNLLKGDTEYTELKKMHTPKKMLRLIGKNSNFGALPLLKRTGLRDCVCRAEMKFESSIKGGNKKNLAILATGSGKTYLGCLASYRLLNYTPIERVLFLADRNNLARQAYSEFCRFDRTDGRKELSTLYNISRLKKDEDLKANIVISTIQKLFAVMTRQPVTDTNEDAEDEWNAEHEEKDADEVIHLGEDLEIPPDYFQFIIVDECHRSIYGRWKSVLDYFSDAIILGLTATPTPEALAYFNNNIIENFTYEASVTEGVNVPQRVYRIKTKVTEEGGELTPGTFVREQTKGSDKIERILVEQRTEYEKFNLDRSVVNTNQIRLVLEAYKKAIWEDLYPEREENWAYIPKTLIFAKDENHATNIVEIVKEVFGPEFESGEVPEHFVQKITYTCGDTDGLIRDMREDKDFRIAVTVTLVATGTDIRPLEVDLFMKDVMSEVLYTQMKGRACRTIEDDQLLEVTPNAQSKECFYLVDAVGVTEHEKIIPGPSPSIEEEKVLSLEALLEHLSHQDVGDENLMLLHGYCSSIHRRYENNNLFGRHLDAFISDYGFSPRSLAAKIQNAIEKKLLPPFVSPSGDNTDRMELIACLINSLPARKKLVEMHHGYVVTTDEDPDNLIYSGFSIETAAEFIQNFEKYIFDHKDQIEALRIIWNSEAKLITRKMLIELQDRLLAESRQFGIDHIWKNYKTLDEFGNVDELNPKSNAGILTNLIQIVRYAYGKNERLSSLITGYSRGFSLYCGQVQRELSADQVEIMRLVAEYVVCEGAFSLPELNAMDTDLWRRGVKSFGEPQFEKEMISLSKILLKVA